MFACVLGCFVSAIVRLRCIELKEQFQFHRVGNNSDAGRVKVYEYSANSWSQLESALDGEGEDDLFGTSVSLSSDGSRLAVGSSWNDIGGL